VNPFARITLAILASAAELFGQAPVAPKAFEVASVKWLGSEDWPPLGQGARLRASPPRGSIEFGPRTVIAAGASFRQLVLAAYNVLPYQLAGPMWIDNERYVLEAKAELPCSPDDLRQMLKALLEERFGLDLRSETRPLPVYDLVVAKGGPKFQEVDDPEAARQNAWMESPRQGRISQFRVFGEVAQLAERLSRELGLVVLDETGLKGNFEFKLELKANEDLRRGVQRFLGLRLRSDRRPVQVLVIDHAESIPTEN
jgi:uncharacterized protein (TIGR03435 family)